MPSRHISNHSFDEILKDLGDDPAIPDPHGIRKSPPQQSAHPKPSSKNPQGSFIDQLHKLEIRSSLQKIGWLSALGGLLIALVIAFFTFYGALHDTSKISLEESRKQISELKNELARIHDELLMDQDDLYLAIEKLEVSIHLLKDKKPENPIPNKPKAPSYEAELRRWRYLGAAQMGGSHQAFFNTGKNTLAFEKGAQVLGDWRLSTIENGVATLTHPHGKSLSLKATKGE